MRCLLPVASLALGLMGSLPYHHALAVQHPNLRKSFVSPVKTLTAKDHHRQENLDSSQCGVPPNLVKLTSMEPLKATLKKVGGSLLDAMVIMTDVILMPLLVL